MRTILEKNGKDKGREGKGKDRDMKIKDQMKEKDFNFFF